MNAGRRVLLLSHANAAVDVAIAGAAEHMKDSYYQRQEIMRLGTPINPSLMAAFPLLSPEAITKSENLRREKMKESLVEKSKTTEETLAILKDLDIQKQKISQLQTWQQELDADRIKLRLERQNLVKEYHQLLELHELIRLDETSFGSASTEQQQTIISICSDMATKVATVCQIDERLRKLDYDYQITFSNYHYEINSRKRALKKHNFEEFQLTALKPQLSLNLKQLLQQIDELETQKPAHSWDTIKKAKLIGATLTKASKLMQTDLDFDVVIVDEASMAPPALLYWAASLAKKCITLVGDFKQLPPVSSSNTDQAKKWFKDSIFDWLEIASAQQAINCPLVTMLDTQYRMNPAIASICNDLCYGGHLQNGGNTSKLTMSDSFGGEENCLVLIDSSSLSPFCSSGRLNLNEAQITRHLIEELRHQMPLSAIGVATPYRRQAKVINELCRDIDPDEQLLINTVHKFQGGEKDAIIFNCCESSGSSFDSSMLNERKLNSSAEVLLNVAISRARKKLFMIINRDYFRKHAQEDSLIWRVIKTFESNGVVLDAANLAMKTLHLVPQSHAGTAKSGNPPESSNLRFCDERNFWTEFYEDLDRCTNELQIVTGFIGKLRSEDLLLRFEEMISRGVKVSLYTRPAAQHGSISKEVVSETISKLRQLGVTLYFQNEAHQKVAIIDGQIAWQGSLNIMSHQGAKEQMTRYSNPEDIEALKRCLELQRFRPAC